MHSRLYSLTLAAKLRLLLGVVVLSFLAVVATLVYRSNQALMDEKLRVTVSVVEQSLKISEAFFQMEKSGQLSRADAQAKAGAEIKAIRYSGKEYVWVNDMTPVVIFHPIKPELEGKNVSEMKDPHGLALFVEFLRRELIAAEVKPLRLLGATDPTEPSVDI